MIYRVEITDEAENHQGFRYYGSQIAADKAAAEARRNGHEATITHKATPTKKAEILKMLNLWASHNDNG